MMEKARWLWLASVLWLALAGVFPPSIAAAPGRVVLPLASYWLRLEETRVLASTLTVGPESALTARLHCAAGYWAGVSGVTLPDGAYVPLDHSQLANTLRTAPAEAAALLTAVLAARRDVPPPVFLSTAKLAAILSRPEFQQSPNLILKWLQNLLDWLSQNEATVAVPASVNGVLLLLILVGGGGALVLILLRVLLRLRADFVRDAALAQDAAAEAPLTAAESLRRAQTLSADGDYRNAVRYLYLSTLLLLEERGVLRYDRSLTNREYAAAISPHPHLAGFFGEVVGVFDRVWYGYHALPEAEYAEFAAKVEALRREP